MQEVGGVFLLLLLWGCFFFFLLKLCRFPLRDGSALAAHTAPGLGFARKAERCGGVCCAVLRLEGLSKKWDLQ